MQVPDPGPVVPKQLVRLPEPAGELEQSDELMEVVRDKEKDNNETGGEDKGFQGLPPATTEIPPCPAVALYGR
eukprot:8601517-Lingulodinium_polyedra.AAC.1